MSYYLIQHAGNSLQKKIGKPKGHITSQSIEAYCHRLCLYSAIILHSSWTGTLQKLGLQGPTTIERLTIMGEKGIIYALTLGKKSRKIMKKRKIGQTIAWCMTTALLALAPPLVSATLGSATVPTTVLNIAIRIEQLWTEFTSRNSFKINLQKLPKERAKPSRPLYRAKPRERPICMIITAIDKVYAAILANKSVSTALSDDVEDFTFFGETQEFAVDA